MKPVYFHYRDKHNRPIVTMCVLYDGTNYGAGIAICSKQDNPCKRTGRAISYARAKAAMEHKTILLPISTSRAAAQLRKAESFDFWHISRKAIFLGMAPNFGSYEQNIIGKALKNEPQAVT